MRGTMTPSSPIHVDPSIGIPPSLENCPSFASKTVYPKEAWYRGHRGGKLTPPRKNVCERRVRFLLIALTPPRSFCLSRMQEEANAHSERG
jgi:hypothetical protein